MAPQRSATKVGISKRGEKCDFRIRFKTKDGNIFDLEYKLVEDSRVLDQMMMLGNKDNCKRSAEHLHVCSDECVKDPLTFDVPFTAEDFKLVVNIMRLSHMNDFSVYIDPKHLVIAIQVADYLDMPSLHNYTLERIKTDLKDKKPSAVREIYEVKDTFTEAETKQMKAEGTWIHNYQTTPHPLETETQDNA